MQHCGDAQRSRSQRRLYGAAEIRIRSSQSQGRLYGVVEIRRGHGLKVVCTASWRHIEVTVSRSFIRRRGDTQRSRSQGRLYGAADTQRSRSQGRLYITADTEVTVSSLSIQHSIRNG